MDSLRWMSKFERWMAEQPRVAWSFSPMDWGVLAILAVSTAAVCGWLSHALAFLAAPAFNDTWFGADTTRVFSNLTDHESNHHRTSVHPLFSLWIATPIVVAVDWLRMPKPIAVTAALSVNAAVAMSALFAVLRDFLPRADAVLYCVLFAVSAGFLFWFGVAETFAWGATSLLIALVVIAYVPFARHWMLVAAASVLTLSFTVTNWMAGIVAAFVTQPMRKAVHVSVYAFATVAALTAVQYVVYPSAGKFMFVRQEHRYVSRNPAAAATTKLESFWLHTIVASPPQAQWTQTDGGSRHTLRSMRVPRTPVAQVAAVSWLALLAGAAWALVKDPRYRYLKLATGTLLFGQCVLHLVYGHEPFLYSAHFLPLLVVTAAFASTQLRRTAAVLCCIVIAAAGHNNVQQFSKARSLLLTELSSACAQRRDCQESSLAQEGE